MPTESTLHLREFLVKHNITQRELASAVGVATPYISYIVGEKRRVHLSLFKDICTALSEITSMPRAEIACLLIGFGDET